MARFRFLHAADLHLDSPLTGLRQRSPEQAARLQNASREAFDDLVALAIDRECRLVLIAGDVFDGVWRDYRTGLFFAERMARLRGAGIRVVLILGNHDAENRFAPSLELADNVRLLADRHPETVEFPELDTAVHGQSFGKRDVRDNLALRYPPPLPGRLNIGLLHTACTGRDGHEAYAPCKPEELANHGYQYWALGHVHAREVVSERPWIVYSGNLQGRSIRETGPKGATLVEVADDEVRSVEHCSLDRIRWSVADLDVSAAGDREAALVVVRRVLEEAFAAADGRALALRLRIGGEGPCHGELAADEAGLREQIETIAAGLSPDLWLERIVLRTTPLPRAESPDPSVAGRMRATVESLADGGWLERRLQAKLDEISAKMPEGARRAVLLASLKQSAAERARELALALIERG